MAPTFSYQMARTLRLFFEIKNFSIPAYVGYEDREVRFNNHNFNPVFLRISSNQGDGRYEIPSLGRDIDIINSIGTHSVGDYVVPLSVIGSQARRTADSMLKYFFELPRRSYSYVLGLKKAVTNKGEVYYGAPGLILNSNFEPLVIGMTEYDREEFSGTFNRHVLKVNPEVFVSEGFLEKAIIKKLIPFYSRNDVEGRTVRVEVDNISKYIVKPVPPKGGVQETFKNMMHLYKDEILKDNL